MLPDFPTIKEKIQKDFEEKIKRKVNSDPYLSRIKRIRTHEGHILTSSSIDGFSRSKKYEQISSGFQIDKDDIIEKGLEAFNPLIDKISQEFIKQHHGVMFRLIEEVTEQTGNVVDAKSKPNSEAILEMLEKVDLNFDEFGRPILPILVGSKDKTEKLKEAITEIESNSDLRKRHDEIIIKKRGEWLDRKSRRKLVD